MAQAGTAINPSFKPLSHCKQTSYGNTASESPQPNIAENRARLTVKSIGGATSP